MGGQKHAPFRGRPSSVWIEFLKRDLRRPFVGNTSRFTNASLVRYGTLALPIVAAPTAIPPTNYVSLSATLQANAAGPLLTCQRYAGVAPGGDAPLGPDR